MLEKIFLQILNMSFTASFVIIFVLIARLFLKKSPKVLSYALWGVVLFRLICPFSFESVFSLLPAKTNQISQDIIYEAVPTIDTGIPAIDHVLNSSLPAATPAASVNPLQVWVFIGTMVWLLGIAILLIYSFVSLMKLQKRLKSAVYEKNNIYLAEHLDTPFVMGIIRPKIYLPASLTYGEKRYILLHEEMHIRRFDHVVKLLSFFVLCLHWFNPFVWVAFFVSGRDMEMSCDEAVIKQLGSDFKKEYSTSLLTLATGRRIIGGTPLAFGEGDTKGRIKNVLNYKKPAFWMVIVAAVAAIILAVGLLADPIEKSTIMVNDTLYLQSGEMITELPPDAYEIGVLESILHNKNRVPERNFQGVMLDQEYAGNHLYQSEAQKDIIYLENLSGYFVKFVSVEDKAFLGHWFKSITKSTENSFAENLWDARTKYVGDNSAVGKLIELLPVPVGLQYDHFKLHTSEQPYDIEIVYSVPTGELKKYDTEDTPVANLFRKNTLLLLALVDNAEGVRAVLTDGEREVGFINGREWADYTMGGDVRDYAESPEKLQELISFTEDFIKAIPAQQGGLTFFVKPDEPPQVIGETAAIIWLKSYMEEGTPPVERIENYEISEVTVISGTPKAGQNRKDMNYHYVVQVNYDITTASDEYFAPGDGVSGKGTFKGLFRELCIKDLGGGNFDIISAGTGGGESEFAQLP